MSFNPSSTKNRSRLLIAFFNPSTLFFIELRLLFSSPVLSFILYFPNFTNSSGDFSIFFSFSAWISLLSIASCFSSSPVSTLVSLILSASFPPFSTHRSHNFIIASPNVSSILISFCETYTGISGTILV